MTLNDLKNPKLKSWLQEWIDRCAPDAVHICDGSQAEYDGLCDLMVKSGTFIKLNNPKNSYLCRSDVGDVARVENRTFICSKQEKDAGPTNNWCDPDEMRATLHKLYSGCMKGRTLYVIPFSMGHVDSPIAKYGIELTDSPYVVVNMTIMTRVNPIVLKRIDKGTDFVKCVHSVGAPLEADQADVPWPCAPMDKKYITHFPETREILSFGSGYGGNALLGKKCFALRIATAQAHDEGWMAEHMLILKLTNPKGKSKFIAAAFPSACGKTNLAMMKPTIKGWKVEVIGDDIAWMKFDKQGRLRAINPEAGFFGVAPGTSMHSNPNAMITCNRGNAIFTNTAITMDGSVYWEEMDKTPESAVDWKRRSWTPDMKGPDGKPVKAANPNARFTVPASQCPVIADEWEKPAGVPISAFLFGGRRAGVVPLANEALSWEHGVFLGATMSSEMTAAAVGGMGQLRFDPFAMLPFCGYHMGDYFAHWLKIGKVKGAKLPKIFYVNWFRKSPEGKWLWPGFGENSRVLEWIFDRVDGAADAVETPIGNLPTPDSINFKGLKISAEEQEMLLAVDKEGWLKAIPEMKAHFAKFGDRLPKEMAAQLEALEARLVK